MNVVQPIRDKVLLQDMKDFLKQNNERNYIMFLHGIHTGLRISDILRLRVRDVLGWDIVLKEKKTDKHKEVKMSNELKRAIQSYVKDKPMSEYLIKSRNGKNTPITREMAYVILSQLAEEFRLERFGTHSLRKTYGYNHYKKFKDVVALQQILNHTDQRETLIYIGIKPDELNKMQGKIDW
ncbi:tyrosine-type recombinase/integrase [Peribacillus butanolivorans]|uniref:tyrosine-type recombinase/integrase n=1 Tax=Peribacillus butanolivorans TaxID=421767 RepID=UPI002E1AF401|nr:tyrosine-type recombinase/integrase [Peribacillus butanolivorans]MED3687271.1 tyrosine-type recombinase/integrase [Peribacillus butanolivorans]